MTPPSPPPPRRPLALRIAARVLVVLLVVIGTIVAIAAFALFTSPGRQGLVALAERLSPSFGYPVAIGAFSDEGLGALRFSDITVGDTAGPFVEIDSVALDWRPSALFDRTVSVDRLALGPTRLLRSPQAEPAPEQPASSGLPLPLPVAIEVRSLEVAGVAIDPAVAGEAVTVAANGALAVPRSLQEPITIDLDARVEGRLPGRAVVDIDYRPADDHLTAAIDLTAPPGGIIQQLAGLSGDQPLTVRYQGDGPLSDWEGTLDVALGATALARGNTRVETVAEGRRVTTGLYLTPGPVLPPDYAALAGDAVQAAMVVIVESGGILAIESASVSAAAASVMATGRINPGADAIDVDAEVEIAAAPAFAGLLDLPATWTGGHVTARLTGRLADPDIAATARIDGVAALDRVTAGRVDVTATATAPQAGTLGIGGSARTVVFQATTASVGLDGAPIASDAAPRLSGEARLAADGSIAFSDVVLDGLGARVALSGATRAGAVDANGRITVPDLAALAGLAGVPLSGSVDLTTAIAAALDGSRATAALDGGAQNFSTGSPELEALLGTAPTLSAALAYDGTALAIERLDVAGGVVTATGRGRIGGADDALTLEMAISDLARVTPTLTGAARLEATATGDVTAPRVAFRLTGDGLVAAGHPLDDFAATGDVDLTTPGSQSGTVALSGASRGEPITGTIRFAREGTDTRLDIDRVDFVGLTASGSLGLDAAGTPAGRLDIVATDVAPAAALAGLAASGGFEASVEIPAGLQGPARIALTSPQLSVAGAALETLAVNGTVTGLPGTPRIDLTATAGGVVSDALPPEYAALAGDDVRAAMVATVQPSGVIAIEAASLSAAAASLTASGSLDPGADTIDLTADITLAPSSALDVPVRWTGGQVNARLTGRLGDPDIAAAGSLDGIAAFNRITAGSLDLEATVTAPRAGTLGVGGSERTVAFQAVTESVGIDGTPVAAAAAPRLSGAVTLLADGSIALRDVALDAFGASVTLDGTTGDDGRATADARLTVPDLAALSGLAGVPLAGSVDLTAAVDAAVDGSRASVTLDGGAEALSAGIPELEALLGTSPTLSAALTFDGTSLAIERLDVAGGVVTATGRGRIGGSSDDALTVDVTVSDLARVTPTLTGGARLEATATGDPTAPRVAFRLTGDGLVAAGHPLDDFAATGDVDLTVAGTQSGTVALSGASRGEPITGSVRFSRDGAGMQLALDRLDFVGLTGSGTLAQDAAGTPSGQLSLVATDLAPAAALAGLVASGGLDATVELPADQPGIARIALASRRLTVEGNTISGLSARGTVAGLPGTPSIDITADIAEIETTAMPGVALLRDYASLGAGEVMTIRYQGSGAPDDVDSRIDVALAGSPVLGGTATVAQTDGGTRISSALALTIASRLPPNLAALAGETVRISLAAVATADGSVVLETADIAAAAGTLTARGNLNPGADAIDVTADITLSDSSAFAALLPAATSWTGGRGTARLTGRLADPDITLDAVLDTVASANRLTAERVTVAAASTAPAEDAAATAGREATFTVATEGVVVADAPVDADVAPRLTGAATLAPDGGVALRDVVLTGLGANLALTATTTADAANADGRIRIADLSTLSGLAGQPLTGAVDLTGTLDAALDGSRLTLALDGGATGFSAGVPEVEALLGPTPTVAAAIAYDGETLTIDRLRVAGGVITAEGSGSLGAANDTLSVDVAVTDLTLITQTLAGAARLTATATGDALSPNVEFRLAGDGLVAAGNRLDGFTATGDLDLSRPGAQAGTVVLAGSSQGQPIAGTIRFGRDANGERLDIERLVFVGLTASGALTRGADGVPAGRLNVVATDLAPAAALAGLAASGGFEANIEMPAGQQGPARIAVASRRLSVAGNTVANLSVNGTVTGLPAAPRLDLTATAGEIVTAGTAVSNLRATASGALDDATVTADARVNDLAVSTAARVQRRASGAIDVAVSRASVIGNGSEIALSRPATVQVDANGGVRLDAALAARGGGTATVTGTVSAQSLSLQARLQQVPLALARLAAADLPVAGTISGTVAVNGTPAAPRGSYDLTIAGLTSPQADGLPPVTAQVRGAVEPTRVTVNGTATAGATTRLEFSGAVPLGAGQIAITVRGNTDLELIELFGLPPTMDVGGRADLDARIAGTTAAPAVTGTVRVTGGSFADITNDIRIEGIASEIRLDSSTARIASFTGRFADGGTLTVTGSVGLDAAAGFPSDLRVATQRAVVRNEPIARGIVDANITLTGPLARAPMIAGTVRLDRVEVTIPDRLPGSAATIPVTHTNVPPGRRQFFPQPNPRGANGQPAAPPPPPFDAGLDLTVTAINQIVVRGSGINADFGGNFRITGTTRAPVVNGGLTLRRGIVDIIGQRLTITTGTISFADTLDPILDLQATTRAGSYTAIVSITGRASAPVIRFSSVPQLPEDEVLSVVLFGQLSSGLNAGQAIALAEAVASLTGARSGGLLAGLRSRLGVDRLGVVTDANNRPAIEIGGYATDNVFVGVQQGAGADSTRVKVQVDITDYLNVQGQLGADGSSALGVGVEVDY